MNAKLPTAQAEWRDPIVEEIHAVRQQLLEKYQGDLHTFSEAATANAIALGFQFLAKKSPPTIGSNLP
jgi:hypothetical protein